MRILLQDTRTQLYFRSRHIWTPSPMEALDFRSSDILFDFVERNAMRHVQLVVCSDEPAIYEIVPLELPMSQPAPTVPLAYSI